MKKDNKVFKDEYDRYKERKVAIYKLYCQKEEKSYSLKEIERGGWNFNPYY